LNTSFTGSAKEALETPVITNRRVKTDEAERNAIVQASRNETSLRVQCSCFDFVRSRHAAKSEGGTH
jgi:hypothetical protein